MLNFIQWIKVVHKELKQSDVIIGVFILRKVGELDYDIARGSVPGGIGSREKDG